MIERIDRYLRKTDTALAKLIQEISPLYHRGPAYIKSKRKRWLIDVPFTLPALPIVIPAIVGISTLKFLEDFHWPFYSGRFERTRPPNTRIWKIRSLAYKTDQLPNPVESADGKSAKDHPHATRMGKILRQTRFDELPQLLLVFTGHMSLVGKRPVQDPFVHHLETVWSKKRFHTWLDPIDPHERAGLTGTFQVLRNSYLERVRDHADNHYRKNATLGYDLYLIWRTIMLPYFSRNKRLRRRPTQHTNV